MSLEEEIKIYGAKGAVVKYIHELDKSIPIEPFVLVPVGENWENYRSEIENLGNSLVRSSSPLEDGKRLSFAGLFSTEKFIGQKSIDVVMESINSEDTLDYIKNNGITEPLTMGLMFQRNSTASWNWSMLRHPHQENIIFISGRPVYDRFSYSKNFVFDERMGKLKDVFDYSINKDREEEFSSDIKNALEFYKKIESMPEFQNGFTYQMEFGTNPLSIYQFRPFRKIEKPSWKLEKEKIKEIKKIHSVNQFSIVFGITPPEGIELTLARVLSLRSDQRLIKCLDNVVNKPKNIAISKISKCLKLNRFERIYAEELAIINSKESRSSTVQALNNSISRINSLFPKEKTVLYQQDIHSYSGKDIDLIFPNAKMWIAEGGESFLSHNLFRAMQYYDLVFIGLDSDPKTGDKVRVYSDGVSGTIKKV